MDNEQLKRGLKLKEEIKELENFLEFMRDLNLQGEVKVKMPKVLFSYKTWRNKERSFKFNDRLTFHILMQVQKELEDLKLQYEAL